MESKHANIEGIRMHWLEAGHGRPVVFVHGIPTSAQLWRHVIPEIDGASSFAWEMVGYGETIPEGRNRDISVVRQAEYLNRWMDKVGFERPILVGHDLGGGVAQIAAVRHQDRVSGLVLTNAICYDSWPIPSVSAIKRFHYLFARMPDLGFRAMYDLLQHRGHDNREMAREAIATHRPYYTRTDGPAALARQTRGLDTQDTLDIADELPNLDIPARIVWGADDPFQKLHYGERLADDLDAPIDRIEGGKHFVPEDYPARIARAVEQVVRAADTSDEPEVRPGAG